MHTADPLNLQPACRQQVPHDMLSVEALEIKKHLLSLPLAKLRENGETFCKLMNCLFMETYIQLPIHFVKMS
jgi:hypothetical protein